MVQKVDFNKLDTVALKRYRRVHKLDDVGPNPTKEELVSAVGKHFTAQVLCPLLQLVQHRFCHRFMSAATCATQHEQPRQAQAVLTCYRSQHGLHSCVRVMH